MGWVANFIDRSKNLQKSILYEVPETKRKEAYGRAARLIVDGPEGGKWDLWFTEDGIADKPDDVPIKNTIYMLEGTLLDLITPDVDTDTLVQVIEEEGGLDKAVYRLRPRLDFRYALANGLVVFDGERPDVDSEEWSQIIEKFLNRIAFPMVIRGLLKAKEKRSAKRAKENV